MTIDLATAFLIGLAGSVHCVAMCGGVISGLTFAIPKQRPILPYALSYNVGRIASYTLAGALAGYLGSIFTHLTGDGIRWLNLISGLFLVALAGYISGWWKVLSHLEKWGAKFWQRLSPLGKRFIPFKSPVHAIPYGIIWGWLPCGLVYSAQTWSVAAGNSTNGALQMLFFGLGTLPSTLLVAFSANQVKAVLQKNQTKQLIALLILLFAIYSISHAL